MKETEYAYIAGLIDGEGHLSLIADRHLRKGLKRNWSYYRPQMGISNTDRELLEWVRDTCGFGFVNHYRQQRHFGTGEVNLRSKPCYCLVISAKGVRELIPHLLPYLRIKKARAELLLEAANIIFLRGQTGRGNHPVGVLGATRRPYPPRLDEIYSVMREMNAKGLFAHLPPVPT